MAKDQIAARIVEELDSAGFIIVPKHPTKEMLRAACKAMSPKHRPTPEWVTSREKHRIRYEAMVAAWSAS